LELYDKEVNEFWQKNGAANSPLALIHGVNFKIEKVEYLIEDAIIKQRQTGEITEVELERMMLHQNNVIKQINIKWRVKKG